MKRNLNLKFKVLRALGLIVPTRGNWTTYYGTDHSWVARIMGWSA